VHSRHGADVACSGCSASYRQIHQKWRQRFSSETALEFIYDKKPTFLKKRLGTLGIKNTHSVAEEMMTYNEQDKKYMTAKFYCLFLHF